VHLADVPISPSISTPMLIYRAVAPQVVRSLEIETLLAPAGRRQQVSSRKCHTQRRW
jgi:hypothetical protein